MRRAPASPAEAAWPAAAIARAEEEGAIVEQLRFEEGLGYYSVSATPDSVQICKGMGTHYFQVQLQVGIPQAGPAAGRLLCLETTLYAPQASGPRAPLASANVSVPFNPAGEVRLPTLTFLITSAQLLALEQRRTGDLRLELQVRGVLPQAASGFPGAPEVTEYITIAESRWRQQLAGLGRTLGAEMLIPFPDDDPPRRAVADFLREAQRLLGGSEIEAAMLQVRKALETIKLTSGWAWPGRKDKGERTVDERSAVEDQASGAMHVDPGTRDHAYTRAEAETLIAMTAALLPVMP
jgi:hypothetical protein